MLQAVSKNKHALGAQSNQIFTNLIKALGRAIPMPARPSLPGRRLLWNLYETLLMYRNVQAPFF